MTWIQSWIDRVYLGLEHFCGASVVARRYFAVTDPGAQLTGYSVAGYEIRLYCQQKHYERRYLWWNFLRRRYSTFRVFGQVSSDAPLALRRACELDVDLPRLRPSFVSEELQKQAAIAAYLDLLLRKMRDDIGTFHPAA